MDICGLEGCGREVYSSKLFNYCWSYKKYRLRYWRQERSKERLKRKQVERRTKAEEYAKKQREYKALRLETQNRKRRGEVFDSSRRFNIAKSVAAKRGLSWTLTLPEYCALTESNKCHYCSKELPAKGSGLDRKDNLLGYELSNVVPCCSECNWIKCDNLSYTEMVAIAELLIKMRDKSKAG